jgi:hypothetical protein
MATNNFGTLPASQRMNASESGVGKVAHEIRNWFLERNQRDTDGTLGNMTLDDIVSACVDLPVVRAWLDDTNNVVADRAYIVRSFINIHIRHYIDNKEL